MGKWRLFDKKGEVKNLDSDRGDYSESELQDAKENLEPNDSWETTQSED